MPMAQNSVLAFSVNGVFIGEPETTAVRRKRHCSGAAPVVTRPSIKRDAVSIQALLSVGIGPRESKRPNGIGRRDPTKRLTARRRSHQYNEQNVD